MPKFCKECLKEAYPKTPVSELSLAKIRRNGGIMECSSFDNRGGTSYRCDQEMGHNTSTAPDGRIILPASGTVTFE